MLNKSETFRYIHQILKTKNVAFFGGYQKAFGHYLRQINAQGGLVRSFNV